MPENGKSKIDWEAVRQRLAQAENALNHEGSLGEEQLAALYDGRAAMLAKRHLGDAVTSATLAVLIFKIAKERYAIELSELAEILAYSPCTPIPNGFPALLGLINVRGEICALLDLARLLELEHEGSSTGGYMLMVRAHGIVAGLKVDQIDYVRELRRDEIAFTKEAIGEPAARHVKGVTQDTVILIDVGSLTRELVPLER